MTKPRLPFFIPQIAVYGFSGLVLALFLSFVNLTPQVSENFFFSSDDPQFRQDRRISEIFPEPQQIIIGAQGEPGSPEYLEKIRALTEDLSALPYVMSAQSLTHGPGGLKEAMESPLWKRILVPEGEGSSNIVLFMEDLPPAETVPGIEKILERHDAEGFRLMVTGPPYILYQIRQNLARDLKVFSLAALIVFGILLFVIFRSLAILTGTLLACLNASALTLLCTAFAGIEVGVLTANLSTIVFVLTLSHCIFIAFNWKEIVSEEKTTGLAAAFEAVRVTVPASFWSMLTTLLGFGSLIFVQATPLQKLGVGGAAGTFVAFLAAYLIFPWFLNFKEAKVSTGRFMEGFEKKVKAFAAGRHRGLVAVVFIAAAAAGAGIFRLNTDPSLLTYFKEGSGLREGLEYMDRNGGSSPLKLVLRDAAGGKFNQAEIYRRLWDLQMTLEEHERIGNIISLPLVMAEGREKIPFSFFLTWEWLLNILEQPIANKIATYFVTEDREQAFFVLQMRESGRVYSRDALVDQIKGIVWAKGFQPDLIGGVFVLQGKLARLVTQSLMWGLALLIGLFVVMGLLISRSFRITAALFLGLCLIPAWMLGLIGFLGIPLDVISAPATNIALGMGVDAMIHILILAGRLRKKGTGGPESWIQSRIHLWKPVMSSTLIVGLGFGLFMLSRFPPTQRFGTAVVFGMLMSPLAALLVLPALAAGTARPDVKA